MALLVSTLAFVLAGWHCPAMPAKPLRVSLTNQKANENPALRLLVGESKEKAAWLAANRPGPKASELHRLVFAELVGCWHCQPPSPLRLLREPRRGSTWEDYAGEVLAGLVRRDLSLLEELGNADDPQAIEWFATLTDQMVQTLNAWVGSKHRPVLQRVAAKRVAWPMRIAKRKPFGDDVEQLKTELPIGRDTIAADPNARFNPASKFGRVAFDLLNRIEHWRALPPDSFWFPSFPGWAHEAKALPQFSRKAPTAQRVQWLAVVEKILEADLKDPELVKSYRNLVSAPSHRPRWESVFRDKVRSEFDSLWGIHRKHA